MATIGALLVLLVLILVAGAGSICTSNAEAETTDSIDSQLHGATRSRLIFGKQACSIVDAINPQSAGHHWIAELLLTGGRPHY